VARAQFEKLNQELNSATLYQTNFNETLGYIKSFKPLGAWLTWVSACQASMRHYVHSPAAEKK
jgi:hypothetical protein